MIARMGWAQGGRARMPAPAREARRIAVVLAALIVLAVRFGAPARAQDFAGPEPPGPTDARASALATLESGLPAAAAGATIEGALERWYGLPEFTTRAVAAGIGWRTLRAALGASQSGDLELGWSGGGLALGVAGPGAGAALRAVARLDQDRARWAGALGPGVSAEVGGGAWVEPRAGVRLWASAPQAWVRGLAPPLARPLEIGGAWRAAGWAVWLARAPQAQAGRAAEHRAGLALDAGPARVWIEARDRPLRGTIGLAADTQRFGVAAAIDGHPVLGETVRLVVRAHAGSRR